MSLSKCTDTGNTKKVEVKSIKLEFCISKSTKLPIFKGALFIKSKHFTRVFLKLLLSKHD